MGVTKYCDKLKKHRIADNNSGMTLNPYKEEVEIKTRKVIRYCLNCTYPECQAKIKDDQKGIKI